MLRTARPGDRHFAAFGSLGSVRSGKVVGGPAAVSQAAGAYQLAMASRLQPLSAEPVPNVTPLSAAIRDQVRTRLTASAPGLSRCDQLRFGKVQADCQALQDWHHLQGRSGGLDFGRAIQRIAATGIGFDEAVRVDTDSWFKRVTDDTGLRVALEKPSSGPWVRSRALADGTPTSECSTDAGLTWAACLR